MARIVAAPGEVRLAVARPVVLQLGPAHQPAGLQRAGQLPPAHRSHAHPALQQALTPANIFSGRRKYFVISPRRRPRSPC